MPLSPSQTKGSFYPKGVSERCEGGRLAIIRIAYEEGEVGSWKNHESHPSRWSSGPPTLMGPRDVFTRDGTTCTDAYPDLGRLALFNAAPSFPRPRPFYLMREGRKYLTPLSLSLSSMPCIHITRPWWENTEGTLVRKAYMIILASLKHPSYRPTCFS